MLISNVFSTSTTRGLTASRNMLQRATQFLGYMFCTLLQAWYAFTAHITHTRNTTHGKAPSELNEPLVAQLIANNSRITRMEFCGNVLGELNVVTIMGVGTALCVSFSIRSNSCTILSSPVYTSTSPSSQPAVLPAVCLHCYIICVMSATSSFISLSTLYT